MRQIVGGRNFRLCIAHRFKPIYISLLATRLPVIGIHHAFGVYKRYMRRWFISRFRSRLLLLGVSNAVRDEIRADLPAWAPARIETLYNRIDVAAVQAEQVSREDARKYLGLPQDAWIVGNVGRLHPDKDQATLIRGFATALPELPPASMLAIMGSGRLEDQLKGLIKRLGLDGKVLLLGQVKNGRRYFKAFDVFALTSDHEPFGMVLLEAMAADVPLISSDCGGAREVVAGPGHLFPLGNHAELARVLQEVAAASNAQLQNKSKVMPGTALGTYTDGAARKRFFETLEKSGLCQNSTQAS